MVREITKDLLASAFGGESMARQRYEVFSETAEKEGFKNVARLFKAIAYSEYIHARNHYYRLAELKGPLKVTSGATFGPGNTSKNLELAIMGEEFEINEMYPAYLEVAKFQGEKGAEQSFHGALEAEKVHAKLYKDAKEHVDRKEDWPLEGKVWICSVCGYTHVGTEAPDVCPICNATREQFSGF